MGNLKNSMKMITAATVLMSTVAVNVGAATFQAVPQAAHVGLVNNPAVAGVAQQFYLTSGNYNGDVQYQIFYIDTANPNREDPTKWSKLQDWTSPINAKTPYVYNIPSLQAGDYSFAVRVKRAGYTKDMTAGYNAAGEYDDAYPFNYNFNLKSTLDVTGIKADKANAAVGEKVTVSGLTGGTYYALWANKEENWTQSSSGTSSSLEFVPKEAGKYILVAQVFAHKEDARPIGWKEIYVNVIGGKGENTANTIKPINSTTLEVSFSSQIGNVSKTDFTIDNGLTVANAAVKQDDSRSIILNTSAQEGGKKYSLSYKGNKVGEFSGVSSVIPTTIKFVSNTTSVKVGTSAAITADIGQKAAGVPVTFNIVNEENSDTSKDMVDEVMTDANGIATYSYTRYIPSEDKVYAYPTGAPAVRDNMKMFWGTDARLSMTSQPTTTAVNNDTAQSYSFKLIDKDGKAVQTDKDGTRAWVTLNENIDSDISNNSSAIVNGVNSLNPAQNPDSHKAVEVTTDADGIGSFSVSGNTTKATPIIYVTEDYHTDLSTWKSGDYGPKLEKDTLQLKALAVNFGSSQQGYKITVDRTSPQVGAATSGSGNSKVKYTFKVAKEDGTVAEGVNVTVTFKELLDTSLNTSTFAQVTDSPVLSTDTTQKHTYRSDRNGKVEVNVWSDTPNTVATPVAWIDTDTAGDKIKEDGEPCCIAAPISFYDEKLTKAGVGTDDGYIALTGSLITGENVEAKLKLKNQSDQDLTNATDTISRVTWTITNTGSNDIVTTIQAVETGAVIKSIKGGTTTSGAIANDPTRTLGIGQSMNIDVDYSSMSTGKVMLRLVQPNLNEKDTTKKNIAMKISTVVTTGDNKTFTSSYSPSVVYATQNNNSITGKVVGILKSKKVTNAEKWLSGYTGAPKYGPVNAGMSYDKTDLENAIMRVLVQVDGTNQYVWADTTGYITNPYEKDDSNKDGKYRQKFIDDSKFAGKSYKSVKIGTDTTFNIGNFTDLTDAIASDQRLNDYLSVGDRVMMQDGVLYVAKVASDK